MNTDRFTDIIRRKLESIRPEFTDKDWARMQATLQQAAPPQPNAPGAGGPMAGPTWFSQPYLLAAAAVSTVLLVAFSVWQRREINDLRQAVQQLRQQQTAQATPTQTGPTSPIPTEAGRTAPPTEAPATQPPAKTGASSTARPDTVYMTRYVPAPTSEPAVPTGGSRETVAVPPAERIADRGRNAGAPSEVNRQRPAIALPEEVERSVKNSAEIRQRADQVASVNRRQRRTVRNRSDRSANPFAGDQPATAGRLDKGAPAGGFKPLPDVTLTDTPNTPDQPAAGLTQVNSRPAGFDTPDWSAALLRRAARLKPVRTTTVGGAANPQTPASQPVERLTTRFRLGVGTDANPGRWAVGGFSEVIIGKHWSLGLGLSRTSITEGPYVDDEDYRDRTRRDFPKRYPLPAGPRREIFNITIKRTRLQLPLSVGYRFALNPNLTLLPSLSTSLNLPANDVVTFYQKFPSPGGPGKRDRYVPQTSSRPASVDLVDNLTFGTALEWHQRHWVLQAGPVFTTPLRPTPASADTDPSPELTAGLRARLFYQF